MKSRKQEPKSAEIIFKASRYNHFFKANDGYILAYNAFSNSFARVGREKIVLIREILKNPNKFSFDTKEKEQLKNDLIEGNFLIDADFDEIEFLKMRNKMGRFSTEYFGLTISPTLDCVFRCSYCFEEIKKESMSKEVEAALIKLVEERLNSAKGFSVTWFGGEPLLKIDIIERLVKKFNKLCDENRVVFSPQKIITNGYLLTKENARKLKELNIVNVQITIDGPPDIHDRRRKLVNGGGTFHRIISNIKDSMELLNIVIRVNLDEENLKDLDRLYDIFETEGFMGKIPFYLGRVISSTDACADVSSKCFSVKDFSLIVLNSIKKRTGDRSVGLYPSLNHYGVCCADKVNSFVVTPSGDLFKCWSEVSFDEKKSIGNIVGDQMKPYHINNLIRYLNWDPFESKICIKCKYLPICGGGCPYFSLNAMEKCTTWKYYLREMLKLQYKEIKRIKYKK